METTEKTKTFSDLIRSDKPVLVDFFAEWCGPCKMMAPIFEELKERVGEKAILLKVDVDKSPFAASAYGIQAVPTLMLFRNGEIKWRHAGIAPAQHLEQIINQNL